MKIEAGIWEYFRQKVRAEKKNGVKFQISYKFYGLFFAYNSYIPALLNKIISLNKKSVDYYRRTSYFWALLNDISLFLI